MSRKNHGDELWRDICAKVQSDDKLPVFSTNGIWSAKKLYFVCQYLEQLTRGMKNRPGFPGGLMYLDLFAGCGITQVTPADGPTRRYPGSPLIAASTPDPFDKLIFVEKSQVHIDALKARLEQLPANCMIEYKCGDSNELAESIAETIPKNALTACFVDPYSLDIHYETIRKLAVSRAMDLIILFSDRFDLGRNVHKYYYPQEEQTKLDLFLGSRDWRTRLDQLDDQSGNKVRRLFGEIYIERLSKLGYLHSDIWTLEGPMGPAFSLVYASKNSLGLKYCGIAQKLDFDGVQGLFG
jgi:three-Cys-motif partner protein